MSGPAPVRCAVVAAQAGSGWWTTAVRVQREQHGSSVEHGDWDALGAEVVATLHALEDLAVVLAGQAERYADRGDLRDDQGADPRVRLATVTETAQALRAHLRRARGEANSYWSSVGHIGLALDDTEHDDIEHDIEYGDGGGLS